MTIPIDAAFRLFIEAQHALVDEALWTPTEHGIYCGATDRAHVSMVEATLTMPAPCLKEPVLVDLDDVHDALKLLDKGGLHGVFIVEDGCLVLDAGAYTHRLRKMSAENARHPKAPSLKLRATAHVPVAVLRQAVRVADSMSHHWFLEATPEALSWSAEGDVQSARGRLAASPHFKKDSAGERSIYETTYLYNMLHRIPKDAVVEVAFNTDEPVRLTYEGNGASIVFWLAPRIQHGNTSEAPA